MSERLRLELQLSLLDEDMEYFLRKVMEIIQQRKQLQGKLNRARRLEREAHNIKIKRVPDLKGL